MHIKKQHPSQTIQTKHLIIPTPSSPPIPPIPPLKHIQFHTTHTIFHIPHIPPSLLIIPGGVIPLHLPSIFHTLQSKLTIIQPPPSIIPHQHQEPSKLLQKQFNKKPIHIPNKTALTQLTQ
ncbi:FAD-dependent oxidoreductase, partial [Bacillus altitudinis]|uniref:FAD-dependent oxidoreductase n=1 Tax=Bacillus altitudinis TaxID=293387 RepID=UPI003B52B60B